MDGLIISSMTVLTRKEEIFEEKEEYNIIFNWVNKDKPINIFYYKNGFGKTTLFNLLHYTFEFKKIDKNFPDIIHIFKIKFTFGNDSFSISNDRKRGLLFFKNGNTFSSRKFKYFIEKNILNKNEKLAVWWKNKEGEQKRNTISSLLRFNFFTDDDFRKGYKNKNKCELINSIFDGETKGILLNYVLGEKFDFKKENLFKIAFRYGARQKLIKNTKKIEKVYPEQFIDNNQLSLFGDIENDFNNLTKQKYDLKNYLLTLESIILKLDELLKDSKKYINNNKFIIKLIKNELLEVNKDKKSNEIEYNLIKERLDDLKESYGSIVRGISPKKRNEIQERKAALVFVEENKHKIEGYFKSNKEEFNKYKKDFFEKLISPIFSQNTINFNLRKLKLEIIGGDKKGDGYLKSLRFLSLVGIILYKCKHSFARNLGIGFFDSPFYGVDMENRIDTIKSIGNIIKAEKINTQFFLFVTKIEKKEIEDSFEKEFKNNDLVYFYETDINKKYLIEK